MKKIFTFLAIIVSISSLFAQIPTTNLSLWLRADAGVTTTTGSEITNWQDQSPNSLSLPSVNGRPILMPNMINGLPFVRFNNGPYFGLTNSPLNSLSKITYFVVGKFNGANANGMFSTNTNSVGLYKNAGTNTAANFFINSTSNFIQYPNTVGTNYIYSGKYDLSAITGQINSTVSSAFPLLSALNSNSNFIIGYGYNISTFFTGDIAELIIYNDALNSTQQQQIYDYLSAKYNLGVNPNAPQIANFGTSNATFDPLLQGTKVAASGFGGNGDDVTISGTNFSAVTQLFVNNISIAGLTINSNNLITFTLPDALNYIGQDFTGKIKLVNSFGPSLAAQDLQVLYSNTTPVSGTNVSRTGQFSIEGTDLKQITAVSVGGINLSFSYNQTTKKIIVSLTTAIGLGSQNILVRQNTTIGNLDYQFSDPINVVASIPAPTITSILPQSGAINDTFTINGANFGASSGDNFVQIGATRAEIVNATTTSLTVKRTGFLSNEPVSLLNLNSRLSTEFSVGQSAIFNGGGGLITANTFNANPINPTSISASYKLVNKDLNGDGKPEIVSLGYGVSSISVIVNQTVGSITSAAFTTGFNLTTGSQPYDMEIEDIDNDGRMDIIISNYSNAYTTIWRNNYSGTGTFNATSFNRIDIPTISNCFGLAVVDIDVDGRKDIVLANNANHNIYVYRNVNTVTTITTSSFSAGSTFFIAANAQPYDVEAGDLNADGKPDLVVANFNQNYVSIFENIASPGTINGSSLNSPITSAKPSNSVCVQLSDIDGDGRADIVSSNYNNGSFSVIRNKNTGGTLTALQFNERADFLTGALSYRVHTGDINGDGKPDVTVANYNSNTVSVFTNNSTLGTIAGNSFLPKTDFSVLSNPIEAYLSDLDGNGKLEMTIARYNIGLVSIYENMLNDPASITGFSPTSGLPLSKVTITGSNFADVAQVRMGTITSGAVIEKQNTYIIVRIPAGASTNQISLVNASGTQASTSTNFVVSGVTPFAVITSVSPINAALNASVLVGGSGFDLTPNLNNIWFGATKMPVVAATANLLTVSVTGGASSSKISYQNSFGLNDQWKLPFGYLFNGGNLTNGSFTNNALLNIGSYVPTNIIAHDLDGDGRPEVIATNNNSNINQISIYRNNTSNNTINGTSFSSQIVLNASDYYAQQSSVGDLDGDGKPEIVVPSNYGATFSIFKNNCAVGTVTAANFQRNNISILNGYTTYGSAIADIDNDGFNDLIFSSFSSYNIFIYRNLGNGRLDAGGFEFTAAWSIPAQATNIQVTDLDGDGKKDVIVSQNNFEVSVFRNRSTVGGININSFATRVSLPMTNTASNVSFADLNNDGKPEIISSSTNGQLVSIFQNNCTNTITAANFLRTNLNCIAGSNPTGIQTGDLDGDGKPEIIIGNSSGTQFSIFKNNYASGNISTSNFNRIDITNNQQTGGIEIADLDLDGKPEFITANTNSYHLFVYKNQIGNGVIPTITGFSPTSGEALSTFVTVSGFGFTSVSGVTLANNPVASFNVINANNLVFRVPNSTISGKIGIANQFGSVGLSISDFTVTGAAPVPRITNITPYSAEVGASVVITGTGFDVNPANNKVYFGAMAATVTGATATSLNVNVPSGATFEEVQVTNLSTGLVGESFKPFVTTFPNSGTITGATFAPRVDISADYYSYHTLLADLDGDGKNDLLSANYASNTFSVYRNTGTGVNLASQFAASQNFSTGAYANKLAKGDIDGDGRVDVVVTNRNSNTVSVFRNTSSLGNISFALKVDFTTGTSPTGIELADLNKDGALDIIVSNYNSSFFSVFKNNNITGTITSASFGAKQDYNCDIYAYDLAVGDIDKDGLPDVAVSTQNSTQVISVFKNTSANSSINFNSRVNIPSDYYTWDVKFADLDSDNFLDMVAANSAYGTVSVFRNTAIVGTITTANFATKQNFTTISNNNYALALADIDGDGKIDITNAINGGQTVCVLRNTATSGVINASSFAPKVDFQTNTGNSYYHTFGDVDGDGIPEMIVPQYTSNTISIFKNLTSPAPTITGFSPTSGQAGVDRVTLTGNALASVSRISIGGGITQTIISATNNTLVFRVPASATTAQIIAQNGFGLTGTSTGTFTISAPYPYPSISGISPIFAASGAAISISGQNFGTATGQNIVYFGASKATVTGFGANGVIASLPTGATYDAVTLLNNQTSLTGANYLRIPSTTFTGATTINGNTFAPRFDISTPQGGTSSIPADFDGDGKNDIAVGYSGTINVFRNISTNSTLAGTSFVSSTFTTNGNPFDIATADIDNDGRLDIIAGNQNSNTFSVLRNISSGVGNIAFATQVSFTTSTSSTNKGIAVADVDLDGFMDVVLCEIISGANKITVFRNSGITGIITGNTFIERNSIELGVNTPNDVEIADLTGDNYPEISIITDQGVNNVYVFRNQSQAGFANFAIPTIFNPAQGGLTSIKAADFDNDGKRDLVFTHQWGTSSDMKFIRNTSTQTSISGTIFGYINAPTSLYFNGIDVGDIDGDGKIDVVAMNTWTSDMRIYRNISTSSGINQNTFSQSVGYPVLSTQGVPNLADLNGDGKPEIFQFNTSARLSIWTNQISEPATITGIAPNPAIAGVSIITITGFGLQTSSLVRLANSFPVSISGASANSFTFRLPAAATNSVLTITNRTGAMALSANVLTVTAFPYPTITSIVSNKEEVGKSIVINGNNFDPTPSNNTVYFGGVKATITAASISTLNVNVPISADYEKIRVVNNITQLSSDFRFQFTPTFTGMTTILSSIYAPKVDAAMIANSTRVALGDLDGDGKIDMVSNSFNNYYISIFRNTGNAGTWTGSSFATRIDFNFSNFYYDLRDIKLADIDLDGKLDIIIAAYNSSNIIILKNNSTNGNISFSNTPSALLANGSNYTALAIADFDLDGKMDIAAGTYNTSNIYIYKNLGQVGTITNASFATPVLVNNTYLYCTDLDAGDLNGDGYPDLVSANGVGYNNFTILENSAIRDVISFKSTPLVYNTSQPYGVKIADLDNDSKLDITLSNYTGTAISIFKNNLSNSTITATNFGNSGVGVSYTAGTNPLGIDVADMDGDGLADILTSNNFSNSVSIFRNRGGSISGTSFSPKVDVTTGANPYYLQAADIDGDGKTDIVSPNSGASTISIIRNSLQLFPTATGINPNQGKPLSIVSISGINLNSINQVAFGGFSSSNITILGGTSILVRVPTNAVSGNVVVTNAQGVSATVPGVFTVIPLDYPTITGLNPLTATANDIIQINGNNFSSTVGNNLVYLGAVQATVTSANINQLSVRVPQSADYGMINYLNTASTLAANYSIPLRNTFAGSGTIVGSSFAPAVNYTGILNQPYFSFQKDLNGDGKPEILVANRGANYVTVYVNNSTGNTIIGSSFSSFNINLGFVTHHTVAQDLDNDGKPEIVCLDYTGNRLSVLKNNYTGGALSAISFSSPEFFASVTNPYTIAIGDLDFDGFNDIVVANGNSNSVSIFKNNASLGVINSNTFASKLDFIVATSPVEVGLTDLDSDGRLDIVTSNDNGNSVSILKNTATRGIINASSFAPVVNYSTPYVGYGLEIGDLNNDGKPEILAASRSSAFVMLFQNNTSGNTITGTSFSRIDIAAPVYGYRNAKIADFDGDGKNDFVVPTSATQVSVYRNISTGVGLNVNSFSARVNYTTQNYPWGLSVGDLDGDFKPEIVAMNYSSNSISILKNLQTSANPVITSFNPSSLLQGQPFTVNGSNFAGITALQVNGQNSPFSIINSQLIVATVAGNGASGLISINGFNGSAFSATALTVIPILIPTITGFNPTSALPNAVVSVLGNNFVSISGISISGIAAQFSIVNAQLITLTVPSAITGKATIINYSGQTQSLGNLHIITNAGADFGRMAFFDGINNYVNIPNAGNALESTNFTFEAMIKRARTTAPNGQDRLWMSINTNGLGVYFENNRLTFGKVGVSQVSTNNAISDTLWHHVAVSYNGSIAKFYYDGIFDSQQAYTQTFNSSNSNYQIGARNNGELFQGRIDEVRIWNIERTIGGINANRCAEINGTEPNLVGYYRFNENASSTTALDASPTGLHANILNFTLPAQKPVSTAKCYAPATILGFSPNPIVGGSNTILTISGNGFTDVMALRLGNFNLPNFTVSGNAITLNIPTTVTNSQITIVNGTETSTSTGILTVTGLIPTFTSITPNAERRGRIITIVGTNFNNISFFGLGNTNAIFSIINAQLITATIPRNASIGAGVLTITNLAGNGFSNFTIAGTPNPSVTGVSPSAAINGNTINITLNEIEFFQSPITIGGTTLANYTLSGNNLSFVVPFSATTGHVRVRTLYGGISPTFTGSLLTILPPPTISDFGAVATGAKLASSGCGGLGELVTIVGDGFSAGVTDVTMNNFNVLNPTVTSLNMIVLRVPDLSGSPSQNLTGKFKITTPAGSVTSIQNMVARFCAATPTTTLGIKNGDDFEVTGNDLINVTAVSVAGLSASFNTNANKLTVLVPNAAPSGFVPVSIAQNTYIYTFPFNFYIFPKPTISGILGSPALIGSTISITGFALTSTSGIAFNGANQTIVSNVNDNLVTFVVPVGAQNGTLSLTAAGGTAVSATQFIVAPSISGVNPTAAGVGRSITLSGSGLSAVNQVFINGVLASIQTKTAQILVINVPNGAISGNLTARISGYTTAGIFFRVIPAPTITDITPGSAIAGTILTISGTGFSAAGINALSFNNTGTANATVSSDNLMLVEVPETASSGYITLSNLGGSTTSNNQFIAKPMLTGEFNPYLMGAGATITIIGKNLFNPTLVTFNNNIAPTFSFLSATKLIAVIPNISSLTPIEVKVSTDGGESNIALYTIVGAPSISSIAPGSGKMGDVITINGANFSLTSNTVLVNGASANYVALSKTVMLVTVPGDCSQATGNIQVQNSGNQFLSSPNNYANSPSNFAVIPSLTAIRNICDLSSVTSAVQGALLRIEGANFINGNTQVFFNTGLGSISTGFGICNGFFTQFSNGVAFVWVPNTATTGNVTVKTNGGTSSPTFLTIIPPPIVSGFSPLTGVAGTVITISGSEFYTVSGVSIGSISAPFTQLSQTQILATITGTMARGKVSISATGGSASSNLDFAPTPVITSISPIEAPANSFINLVGTNLYAASQINFAGTNAINWSDGLTNTSVRVPLNASNGIISYTNAGGTAVSPFAFTVSTILGMSTNTGVAGTLVTLTGDGLTSATNFSFNSSSQFSILNTITGGVVVSVPGAATSGAITLHFPNGGSTTFGQFNPTPVITSISPNTHGTDQFVNISGTNIWEITAASFGGVLSNNLGSNSGSSAVLVVTRNNVKVPTQGLSGLVSITVAGGGVASSPSAFTVISISGILPNTALGGTQISVSGANLDNLSGVSIGGSVAQFSILNSQLFLATVPSVISSGQIIVSKDGGFNDSYAINLPDASIAGITPSNGPIGTIITINGNNFTAARGVQLYNAAYNPFIYNINYQVVSATRILATVTGNGISGNIRVVGQNNNLASGPLFTMPPVLNTLPNPGILPAGQSVVLNGGNLTAPTTINVGGIQVPVINYSAGSISFVMPAIVGNNIITVGNSAGVSTVNFGFLSITSISTTTGIAGNRVSIVGSSLSNVEYTTFNAENSVFTVENSNLIVATVPSNAGNGVISVKIGSYSVQSSVSFFPKPVIHDFIVLNGVNSTTARLGSTVSLTGTNLNNVNSVTLGGSSNAYSFTLGCTTGNTGLSLHPICIPNNANSGQIVVNNGTYTASITGFNFVSPPGTISGVAAIPGNQVTLNGTNLNTIIGVSFGGIEALAFTQVSTSQLTAIVPFNATLSGTAQVRTQGGNTNSLFIAPPIITALSKTQGAVGIGISVSAFNISGINQVIFPVGITATGTNNFSNNIAVNVPIGAQNGFVSIRNEAGLGISPINFDVLPMPTILGISPSNGGEGTSVLISGTNLDLISGVFFGNGSQSATFTIISPTQIQVTAPVGVLTGKIHITNANIYPTAVISPIDFVGSALFTSVINTSNVNAPYIGRVGESIQINGANFSSPFKVFFNGIEATTANFVNSTQVTASVPVGASSGLINVSSTGGDFQTNQSFDVVDFPNAPVAIVTNSCTGQTFRVNYSVTGIFPVDNVFYVDIMDGSTPVATSVGNRSANNSGFVSAIIPAGLAGNYTTRIRSSSATTNYGLTSTGSNTFAITNLNNWLGYTTNWSTLSNWGCGVLPTSQSYVIIDNSPIGGNQPTIFGSATSGTVEVNGGQLTLTSAGILTLFNDLKLSSTAAYQANPTSFTLINGTNATVVSAVGHAEVGNITIATSSKLTLGSPLKVKGSFVNNVNTSYYASYAYGWYNIYGFNSNSHAVTIEGSNFQTVGNPGFYATLFDELVLNNNTTGAGIALAGPVQVKCKLINYGIFNANNFLTEFVNGPCSPQLIAQSPTTTFDNIVFNNTLTAVNITRPIRVRGNFTRAGGAQGVTMPTGSAIEFVGTSAVQTIDGGGQAMQFNDFSINNPFGVVLGSTAGNNLEIAGNFINNSSFTDINHTISFTGSNITIGGTGDFNLNQVELAPSSGVVLKRPIRVRGSFKSKGTFDAAGQTITFNAPTGVQTIESTNPARLSGIEIVSTSVVTTSSALNINGNIDNAGKFVAVGNTAFDGTSLQTIAGAGLYELNNVSVTNAGININSSLAISGDLTTNGALVAASNTELTFAGTNTNISGNTEPQLANITINTSAGVRLNRPIRVRGNFKSAGTLVPNNQTVTFDATGGQTIESSHIVSFSGVNVGASAQVLASAPLAVDGSLNNAGLFTANQQIVLNGSAAQTIAGVGTFNFNNITNTNTSTDSVKILAPILMNGNLENNGNLISTSDIQFGGTSQTISGTVDPILTNLEINPSASVALQRPIRVRGNFKNNSATTGLRASAPVTLEGNSVQTISGTAPTAFETLNLQNQAGVVATNQISASGLNIMTRGRMKIPASQPLVITSPLNNAITRSDTGYVVGGINRVVNNALGEFIFPVGNDTQYRGATITFTGAASGSGSIAVNSQDAMPQLPTGQLSQINNALQSAGLETIMPVYWNVDATNVSGGQYDINFDAKLANGAIQSAAGLQLVKRHLPTDQWELVGNAVPATFANGSLAISRTSISGFSQFAIAGACNNVTTLAGKPKILTLAGIGINNDTLMSNTTGSSYQWSRNGVIVTVSGATLKYKPLRSGDYRLTVFQNGCRTPISDKAVVTFIITLTGFDDIEQGLSASNFSLSPNPATSDVVLEIENPKDGKYTISINDMIGKEQMKQTISVVSGSNFSQNIDISSLSKGMYFVKITQNKETKVLKLVVE